MVLGPVPRELLVREPFGPLHERHHLDARARTRRRATSRSHAIGRRGSTRQTSTRRASACSASRAGTSSRSCARASPSAMSASQLGTRPCGVGLARVQALVGLGEAHRARLDRVVRERFGRPRVEHTARRSARRHVQRRRQMRHEEVLGHVARSRRRRRARCPRDRARRSATTAWSRGSLIAMFVTLDRSGLPHEQADPAVVEPRVGDARVGRRRARSRRRCRSARRAGARSTLPVRAGALDVDRAHRAPRLVRPHDGVARVEQVDPPPAGLGAVVIDARARRCSASRIAQRSSRHSFSLTTWPAPPAIMIPTPQRSPCW